MFVVIVSEVRYDAIPYGPFDDAEAAREYADKHIKTVWQIAEVRPPEPDDEEDNKKPKTP